MRNHARKSLLPGAVALSSVLAILALARPDTPGPMLDDGIARVRAEFAVTEPGHPAQEAPSIAFAPDGALTVAWQSRRHHNGLDRVRARSFGVGGEALGDEFALAGADAGIVIGADGTRSIGHERAPALAIGPDATAWAAWLAFGRDGSGDGGFFRTDRSDGAAAPLADDALGDQRSLVCAVRRDGSAVFGWLGPRGGDASTRLHLRAFDAGARPLGGEVVLDAGERVQSFALATIGDDVAVAWTGLPDDARAGLHLQHLTSGLVPRHAPIAIAPTGIEPALAGDARGSCLVWFEPNPTGAHDLFAQHFDARGARLGDVACLARAGDRWLSGAHAARLDDGTTLVAWNDEARSGDDSSVVARRCDPARGAGTPFRPIAADCPQRLPVGAGRAVATGPDGRIAFAWCTARPGERQGVHVTLLASTGSVGAPARASTPPWRGADAPMLAAEPHDPPTWSPPVGAAPPIEVAGTGGDRGFTAITNTGWTPPDPHVAVGPGHAVIMTNGAIAIFTKDGTPNFQANISGASGFWGALGATSFVFDPEVIWDPHAGRFIAMACERNPSSGAGSSYFVLAISDDADPNGTWHKYRIDVTALGDIGSGGGDIDSPNIMVDANVLYLSADFFRGGLHHLLFMLDKTPLLQGQPVGTTRSLTFSGVGSFGLPVVHGSAPAAFMIHHRSATSLRLYAITNPLTTPTTQTFDVTVPAYSAPVRTPQLGTTALIQTFDARFWSCVWVNGSLWATHHEGSTGRTRQRWYEIRTGQWPLAGSPALAQVGDVDNGPNVHTYFGSICADASGHAVLCYAQSSPSEYISIGRSFRLPGDAPGTLRPRQLVRTNSAPYTTAGRWGDYSEVVQDPVTPRRFFYTHEYASGAWLTWIGHTTVRDWLAADTASISATTGGSVGFEFENSTQAGRGYLLLGTFSGRSPGTPLNPGGLTLPINYDGLTGGVLSALNTPVFSNFLGFLDGDGYATMQLNVPPGVGALAGLTSDWAAAVFSTTQFTFASNAVPVAFRP